MPSYSGVFTLQAQMQAIAAGNWPGFVPPIGSAFGGGFFAGQIGVGGVATHNLVVGPLSTGQSGTTLQWKNTNTTTPSANSNIDGPQNTASMVADGNSTVYPCAHFCNNAVIGGFSDWYMPALNELEVCYFNLKPTTAANVTNSGINANAVPARASNYTGGSPATNPAQTSAATFQTGGAQPFAAVGYWSSTEAPTVSGSSRARFQRFNNGYQFSTFNYKTLSYLVRCVRRVPV